MHQSKSTTANVAARVRGLVGEVLGAPLPLRVRAWDGTESGPSDAPTIVVRNRRALRHLAWSPNQLGLARAYVSGDLDVEGDMFAVLQRLLSALDPGADRSPSMRARWRLARSAVTLGAVGPRPPLPPEEMRQRDGRRHSKQRDAAAVVHHYDVGNDFYRLVLGTTMVYSCAYFDVDGDASLGELLERQQTDESELDRAQQAKLDLVCRKLALRPGMRLLDVGCGWGSMALRAAAEHGVEVVGVTLSPSQAELARERVRQAGLEGRVEIRVQDYRDVDDGPYDAISSIGMAEHVGREQFTDYARDLLQLLRHGGRLLNHMIATHEDERAANPFIDRYVFPDGELMRVGEAVSAIEHAGLEVRDVQALREHYSLTLRHWVARLERRWEQAVAASSDGRARVWRLYMAASALAFEERKLGVNQVLAVRPLSDGSSGMPLVVVR
jgi:cyclopropane-fatty-acyl-phospholipid synthase